MMDPSANKDDIPKRLADALTAFFDMDCPGPFIGMLRCKRDSAPLSSRIETRRLSGIDAKPCRRARIIRGMDEGRKLRVHQQSVTTWIT
jgi:hypothetical protein